ncbi:unnamed protein product [Closterium sp. NIES-54]
MQAVGLHQHPPPRPARPPTGRLDRRREGRSGRGEGARVAPSAAGSGALGGRASAPPRGYRTWGWRVCGVAFVRVVRRGWRASGVPCSSSSSVSHCCSCR